jgi:hypothetical protein
MDKMDFFVKNYIMKKPLLFLLAINLLFVLNYSFGQSFNGSSDVISYSSGKVFSNTDKSVKIQIGYDGITVNGNLAYFNLEISVLNTSVALIKGYSLSNPDGTISFRLNSSTGCIVQGGDSYCSTSTNSNSQTPTDDIGKFTAKMPFSIYERVRMVGEPIYATLTFERNGTAKYEGPSGVKPCTWEIAGDKIKIYMNGAVFYEDCTIRYTSDGKIGLLIRTERRVFEMNE